MKTIEGTGSIKLAIVCCLHGNEVFGKTIFDYFESRLESNPGLRLILANEEAHRRGIRYVDKDLNTAFPGDLKGNHEERLAAQIMLAVRDAEVILDIHTTSSDIEMVPIICSLDKRVKRVIQNTCRKDIAQMMNKIAAPSLIGNVGCGISLEFGQAYATTDRALREITKIVEAVRKPSVLKPCKRRIFRFDRTIPLDLILDKPTVNFELQRSHDFYPFLFDEKSNENDQGFSAVSYLETKF